jgi:hypothetical protein
MTLNHKEIVFPEVDTSLDDGDPEWHEAGGKEFVREGEHYRWTGLEPGFWTGYWGYVKQDWEETVTVYETDPLDVVSAYRYVDLHPVFWTFSRNIATFKVTRHAVIPGDLDVARLRVQQLTYRDREGYPGNHLRFLEFEGALRRGFPSIDPHRVCPETGRVEEDESRNTATEWWYEFGPYPLDTAEQGCPWHDYQLDGGAATFEVALTELAGKVWEYYGNDRRVVDSPEWRSGEMKYGGQAEDEERD